MSFVLINLINFKNGLDFGLSSPRRITVLHKTGTLGPFGRPGSTPGVGVIFIDSYLENQFLLLTLSLIFL